MMERTAIFGVILRCWQKREKPANPLVYWLFRWRRRWDSNPRNLAVQLISSQSRYDHFDTSPYMLTAVFRALFSIEKGFGKNWRKEQLKYSVFELYKTLILQGFQADKTTIFTENFECCTFDHSDNSPCLFSSGFLSRNLLKNSLGRKQERKQKIFDFEIFRVEMHQRKSGGRNSQLLPKFRVLPLTTSWGMLHVLGSCRILN